MWFIHTSDTDPVCSGKNGSFSHCGPEHENCCDLLLLHWNTSHFTMVFLIVRACVCMWVCVCVCGVKHSQCAHLNHQDDLVRRPWRRLQEAFLFMWGAAAVRLRSPWICSTLNPRPSKRRRRGFSGKQRWSPSGSSHVVRAGGPWKAPFHKARFCTEYFLLRSEAHCMRFYYYIAPLACSKIHKHLNQHEIWRWGRSTVKLKSLYVRLSLTGLRKINFCCRTRCVCECIVVVVVVLLLVYSAGQCQWNAVGVSLGLKIIIVTRQTGWKVWHFNSVWRK